MKDREQLARLLRRYPAPWRLRKTRLGDGEILDRKGHEISGFAIEDWNHHAGVVAAVNVAARTLEAIDSLEPEKRSP